MCISKQSHQSVVLPTIDASLSGLRLYPSIFTSDRPSQQQLGTQENSCLCTQTIEGAFAVEKVSCVLRVIVLLVKKFIRVSESPEVPEVRAVQRLKGEDANPILHPPELTAIHEGGRQHLRRGLKVVIPTSDLARTTATVTPEAGKQRPLAECATTNRQSQRLRGISGVVDNMQILMSPARSCCALAILLATVDFQCGGCIHVTSSASQRGGQLDFTCTLWHKKDEAEGLMLFWCKDRSWDCSPETSLEQLRVKRDPGTDGITQQSSQLVFTIGQATPSDSGTYQCRARSQRPEVHIHGHFFSVLVTGNHTEISQRQKQRPGFSRTDSALTSGFLQAKAWGVMVTSLAALQGYS
ncbi:CD160 antigen [Onychomys torridus]|uniref:CD160 antigen n=1 Tax=Onychomys torridus TaxID=38674 RepID=UPI00167F7F7D|nr:CD160 antigen [Onychomys torridus]